MAENITGVIRISESIPALIWNKKGKNKTTTDVGLITNYF